MATEPRKPVRAAVVTAFGNCLLPFAQLIQQLLHAWIGIELLRCFQFGNRAGQLAFYMRERPP